MIVGLRKIWLERNARVLDGKVLTMQRVVELAAEEHRLRKKYKQAVAEIRGE